MTEEQTMKAQQAVEAVLAHRAANEPGFVERVAMDPRGVVAPIVAEILEDDGDLDLSDVAINVHVQSPKSLHFVMATDNAAEVSGFARFGGGDIGSRLGFDVMGPTFGGGRLGATDTQQTPASTNGEKDSKCRPSTH